MVNISVLSYILTPIVSPYDHSHKFSKSALCRLEAAGINVVTSLETHHTELVKTLYSRHQHSYSRCEPVREWVNNSTGTNHPPTWRGLYDVLRKMNMEKMAQEIEQFLDSKHTRYSPC